MFTRSFWSYAMTLAVALLMVNAVAAAPRTEVRLNAGWLFHYGETPNAESPRFDASAWSPVNTPHTWNALDGQDGVKTKKSPGSAAEMMKGDYARGTGWYRRTIKADPSWSGHQVYLQFDGANQRADVFLNGCLVGTHLGGYARFRFNITGALKRDADNVLAVKVNNADNGIAPHSADFTSFGGLYRDVALLVTDSVQIETMDYASPGVFLEQSKVTAERAEVKARVKLANHETELTEVTVSVAVTDAAGQKVVEASAPAKLVANGSGEVTVPLALASPHLWNGRTDPYLYTARVEVSVGGAVRDVIEQPLGLRFFRVDPQQGFFLNGKYLDLHGVSRHQDRLDKGWAISPDDEREDMALIAEMGCTAIRVAHYQQSPLWYQLADEQGLALWAEIPFVDEAAPTSLFFNNALDQMRELIRQNYNHPAIIFWGCGNENHDLGIPITEGMIQYGPISERQLQALNALARAEDSTRPTTYASFHSEKDVTMKSLTGTVIKELKADSQRWYTDVTAFNKYFGWYYGEPDNYAEFFDGLHARNPAQCLGLSEYGAGGAITQHSAATYGGAGAKRTPMENYRLSAMSKNHPEEYQSYYHEVSWSVLATRPYIWSKFIWNMFDFASDGRSEGEHPGRNDKGLVTYDRKTRKDVFYFYKATWSTEPVLRITSSRFTERNEATTVVKIYSNAPEVELFVNGQSLGKQTSTDKIFRWQNIVLTAGKNLVRATGLVNGKAISDECVWTCVIKASP